MWVDKRAILDDISYRCLKQLGIPLPAAKFVSGFLDHQLTGGSGNKRKRTLGADGDEHAKRQRGGRIVSERNRALERFEVCGVFLSHIHLG